MNQYFYYQKIDQKEIFKQALAFLKFIINDPLKEKIYYNKHRETKYIITKSIQTLFGPENRCRFW